MNPRFPLYIPSKGRAESRLTSKALEAINVPYRLVIESQEYKEYAAVVGKSKLLILDKKYQEDYPRLCGIDKAVSAGPGAARNFIWDHSISEGHPWHWVMDDNIRDFYRLTNNKKIRMGDGTHFRAMEDFCLRYTNIAMAGPNYELFVPRKHKVPPFITNTRIYSCNLIRNDVPFRWRGRYNEDTILSLDMLKMGWCTIQFNAFLQNKVATQTMKGGNTAEFYAALGTLPKSQMLVEAHPDVSRLVQKFGRWHHHVDYSKFKRNLLEKRPGLDISPDVNNYNLEMIEVKKKGAKRNVK